MMFEMSSAALGELLYKFCIASATKLNESVEIDIENVVED